VNGAADAELVGYRHDGSGLELPLPARWERAEEVSGCLLVAVEPKREPYFRANVVVTLEVLDENASLREWSGRSTDALRESLNRLRLIDDEHLAVAGVPARRLLAHYLHREHGGLCLEQWLLLHAGIGQVVSCSTAALEYDDLFPLMSAITAGFRPAQRLPQ
jgi:hypothetical protein